MGLASRGRALDPELLTIQLAGLDIGSAHDVRVTVEAGELVVLEGGVETLRSPAERITGAVWFSPEETLELLGRRWAGVVARFNGLVRRARRALRRDRVDPADRPPRRSGGLTTRAGRTWSR
ncbi:MAG TPA: hypothetical protein VK204_14460 [Nocardioidaceae bacterium]|nr:hypothetical protein [Nocardioidaceae bacterium]